MLKLLYGALFALLELCRAQSSGPAVSASLVAPSGASSSWALQLEGELVELVRNTVYRNVGRNQNNYVFGLIGLYLVQCITLSTL